MPFISSLYIYPVKSLGGISVDSVELTDRGFRYDRRWALVDSNNQFVTQREYTQLSQLQTELRQDGIFVYKKNDRTNSIVIPFSPTTNPVEQVAIWDDVCSAVEVDRNISNWFTGAVGMSCKLMFMPDHSQRRVDPDYAVDEMDITSFADAYPVLLIAQESLDDLNSRMNEPLPMNRFRPNMVIKDVSPYEEDEMKHFIINNIDFFGVKLCARCVLTTVDQQTGVKGKEPLRTLAKYRSMNNKIYFGQNIIYKGVGTINVGDAVKIMERSAKPFAVTEL